MKKYVIGISCIGSGVGQSIINSLRLSNLPIITVGFGTNPFAYGSYDCDYYDYTPTIYSPDYIKNVIKKCQKYGVDLLIPGLDDEVLLYSQNEDEFNKFGIKAIFIGKEMASICRDKEKMSQELNQIEDVFVKSYSKTTLDQDLCSGKIDFPFIAKPRGGFASRNIEIIRNTDDLIKITDSHIIQELAIPTKTDPNYEFYMSQIKKGVLPQVSEISIQIVYSPEGRLMGRMSSFNRLNNGVPIEVVPFENKKIWDIVDKLTPKFLEMGLKGPLNIQGRITDKGFKIFEMNPRFTGITGLRAIMGFNEVEACVKEWLKIDKDNQLVFNQNRFGMRQTADKSVPIKRNNMVTDLFKTINRKDVKKQEIILITGASGYLGQNLINKLSKDNNFKIWAFGSNKKQLKTIFGNKVAKYYDYNDYNDDRFSLGQIDLLLHLGFARPYRHNQAIADSLEFTFDLFTRSAMHQVPRIINISSQSVYGLETEPPWTEATRPSPSSSYAQAKYSTELFLRSLSKVNNQLKHTSIRLASLAGGSPGLTETDFMSKISRDAYDGKDIVIIDGNQQMERLDIRDATDALIKLIHTDSFKWKPIYNLGPNKVLSLLNITKKIIKIAPSYNQGIEPKIIIDPTKTKMKFGMDSSLFYKDIAWKPKYSIDSTIRSLFQYFKNKNEK